MIAGSHVIVYSRDPEADRAFFRDVLRFPSVDAGGSWLIFALPPAEVAVHPAEENDVHELYLMCTDLRATMDEMRTHGIRCEKPSTERWGVRTVVRLPGGGRLGLYQPTHPTAIRLSRRRASATRRPAPRRTRARPRG